MEAGQGMCRGAAWIDQPICREDGLPPGRWLIRKRLFAPRCHNPVTDRPDASFGGAPARAAAA